MFALFNIRNLHIVMQFFNSVRNIPEMRTFEGSVNDTHSMLKNRKVCLLNVNVISVI